MTRSGIVWSIRVAAAYIFTAAAGVAMIPTLLLSDGLYCMASGRMQRELDSELFYSLLDDSDWTRAERDAMDEDAFLMGEPCDEVELIQCRDCTVGDCASRPSSAAVSAWLPSL